MRRTKFKCGDVVVLKGGSMPMTVERIAQPQLPGQPPTAHVVWFFNDLGSDLSEKWTGPHRATFDTGLLVMADVEPEGDKT